MPLCYSYIHNKINNKHDRVGTVIRLSVLFGSSGSEKLGTICIRTSSAKNSICKYETAFKAFGRIASVQNRFSAR